MAKQPAASPKRGPGDGSGKEALLDATIEVVGKKGAGALKFAGTVESPLDAFAHSCSTSSVRVRNGVVATPSIRLASR